MIEVRSLTRRFDRIKALDQIDLTVKRGTTTVVFGPNGSGKSTLLRIVAGLARPTRGEVLIDGKSPRLVRGSVGFVGHEPYLYPWLTVMENLQFFSRLYGLDANPTELLESFRIEGKAKSLVNTLSRGETQKASIARALLHDPDYLLLDEPFSGLDDQSASALAARIKRDGRTSIVVTHDLQRGNEMADDVVHLMEGRLISGSVL